VAWDTEGTRRRILDAATTEFAARGPDGTTVERIAKVAGVNKERVYNYFGGRSELFARVLQEQLAAAAQNVAVTSFAVDDVGEYAGRLYDYHRQHPELMRLLQWEALAFASEVPDEEHRQQHYGRKNAAVEEGRAAGAVTSAIAPDLLNFLLLSLAAYWAAVPQVARMITGATTEAEEEHVRRRASVVEAARRLADPAHPAPRAAQPLTSSPPS
jgi:AcrR family transcriptional regulator